ncbi:MAG: phosphoglycerate dehydrogenase [Gammaproteobacteria bacterium]
MTEIVISTSSFDLDHNEAIDRLRAAGVKIATNPFGRKLTETEIGALLTDSVVGLLAGVEPLTADVIAGASALRVISRCGVGLDNVDEPAAHARDIQVLSTPGAPVDAVAEITIGLMLATLRRIPEADRQVRRGEWPRLKGRLLKAQTVGILGLGRIGSRVADLCSAFGARVIAHDPIAGDSAPDVLRIDLPELLSAADILSLHRPVDESTRHLINRETLAAMKPGSLLINTARGGLVDEAALLDALRSGRLGGAGLDVYESEPYSGDLTSLPQVVLTPHLASSAVESRREMELEAARNLYVGLQEAGVV